MRIWVLAGLLTFCLPMAAGAQAIGQFTPGHALRANTTSGAYSDAGGAAGSSTSGQGYLTELGITNTGTPVCIDDALTSGPYHQLCLGANALGGGLISYNAYGGASPLGLNINLNGTSYAFPGPGNGNVVGPTSAISGNIASFNGTGGKTIQDSGFGASAVGRYGFSQYGVVANGTDQTANAQAAINAAHTAGVGVVCDVNGSIPVNDLTIYGSGSLSTQGDQYYSIPGCKLVPKTGFGGQDLLRVTDAPGNAYSHHGTFNVGIHGFRADMKGQNGAALLVDACIECTVDDNFKILGIGAGTFTFTDATALKTVTIGGTITVGNTITYTLTSASLNGGTPVSVVYTVANTDTTATVASNSSAAINNNSTLTSALVDAATSPAQPDRGIVASTVVKVYYPAAWTDLTLTATVSGGGTETAVVANGTITYPSAGIVWKGDQGTGSGAYYARIVSGGFAPSSCTTGVGLWMGSSGQVGRPNAPRLQNLDFVNANGNETACGFDVAIDLETVGDAAILPPTDVSFSNVGVLLGGTGKLVTDIDLDHLYFEQPNTCGILRTSDSTTTRIEHPHYTTGPGKPVCGVTYGHDFTELSGSLTIGFNAGLPTQAPAFSTQSEIQEVPPGGSVTVGGSTNGLPGYHELMGLGTGSQYMVTRYDSSATPYSWASLQAVGNGEQLGQIGFAAATSTSSAYFGSFAAGITTEAQTGSHGGQAYAIYRTLNGTVAPSQALTTTTNGGVALCGDVSGTCALDPGLGGLSIEGDLNNAKLYLARRNYTYALSSAGNTAVGSGYKVGDTITTAGGTCTSQPIITVDNVNGSGAITTFPATAPLTPAISGFHISTAGNCSVRTGSLTQGSTSGTGSGATFTAASWSIATSTAIQTGQTLGEGDFFGYDGSADYQGAGIFAVATETFVHGTNGGTEVDIKRTKTGSATLSTGLSLQGDGSVLVCNSSSACGTSQGDGALGVKGAISEGSATLLFSSVALSDASAAQTATLTNAPTAGNPTKWIAINDNGTVRHIPAW